MSASRVVAVLGYSCASRGGLHEICSARLRRAELEARDEDVVLLSGWRRRRRLVSEGEAMARAWKGPCRSVVVDRSARSTVGNVAAAAGLARSLGARQIVVVTSGWHARRAGVLMRAALRGSGVTVQAATSDEPRRVAQRVRELACWLLVPFGAATLAAASQRHDPW